MLVMLVSPAPGNLESSIHPHTVPIELPVVTLQSETWLERAWNCAGTSEQNLFEYRYYCAGREGVISVSGWWTFRDTTWWWSNETCRQRETQAIRGCVRVYVGR